MILNSPAGSTSRKQWMSVDTCVHQKAPRRSQESAANSEPEPGWRGNTPAWPTALTLINMIKTCCYPDNNNKSLVQCKKIKCTLYLSSCVCRRAHLSVVPEGPLQQSLLHQSCPHFHLQQPLCTSPALVGVGGVEDKQHQQIYHLTWQRTFGGEMFRFTSPQTHRGGLTGFPTCPWLLIDIFCSHPNTDNDGSLRYQLQHYKVARVHEQ